MYVLLLKFWLLMGRAKLVQLARSLTNQKDLVLLYLWDQYNALDRDKYVDLMDNVKIVQFIKELKSTIFVQLMNVMLLKFYN